MGRKTYQEAKNIWRPKQFIQRKEFRFSTHAQLQLPDAEVVNEDPVAFLKIYK